MKNRTISIILATFLLLSADSKADTEQKDTALQIYLPREITIQGNVPILGQVAIIRGNESLAAKAGKVTLGRISAPGQNIIVDRLIVLSRLACSGIPVSEVTLIGAEKITVKQQHQSIKGSEFVENALAFLKKKPFNASICRWDPTRIPKDLTLSGISKDLRLSACLIRSGIRNQVKVRVTVFSNDREMGVREVTFRLKYNCRRVVTKVDIPQGAVITPENVKIEKTISNYPEPADWTGSPFSSMSQNGIPITPYGLITRRRLPANIVIRPGMVGPVKPEVSIKRNQGVVIRIDRLGLLITVTGKSMQDGRVGELIKVKNMDSQRIILAKVNEDGTVAPVF
ncbi:MAG: flagellar basal body P-ring formation protein FlgA [Planctomycetes bacterium]|nr:flagellar basal body P-ring formation protein FlgA [Planctomycetota bacterium]